VDRTYILELNKRLFKAFQIRGITVGAVPDLQNQLISDYLIENNQVSPETINSVLEEVSGIQALDPSNVSFDSSFIDHAVLLIPESTAREEVVFPVKHEGEYIYLVMARPQDDHSLRRLESTTGSRIKPYCCNSAAIIEAIDTYYTGKPAVKGPIDEDVQVLADAALKSLNQLKTRQAGINEIINDAHLIRLLQHMMNSLVRSGISDLHIEPREDDFRIRYRKDGVMQTAWTWPTIFKDGIIPRLKLISKMDLKETLLPQDGSISFGLIRDRIIDIRVSSLPSLYGEKIVMRVLERDKEQMMLTDLGMEPKDADTFNQAVHSPTGMILVTGPTGSGKSTTLYAVLNDLNTDYVNIVTAEDPVEYKLNGLTQVNCSAETGLTFNEALKSFLRQDPDIIMVGEIRDIDTADIALKAAMTGHLVLSTLHTNDAAGAISRLTNMGLPPFLVASAKITVVAQRLLRKLCPNCKTVSEPDADQLAMMGDLDENTQIYKAVGCPDCNGTGYNGRLGVYEVFQVSDRIIELILNNEPSRTLKMAAVEEGMVPLREAALKKMIAGLTTMEEVIRVTMDA
jgi:type IV pilus assembly protein PilB